MNKIMINETNYNIISNLIGLIDKLSVIIYERDNDEVFRLLINIIDRLDSIIGVKSILILEENFKTYINELNNKLPDLLSAFENNDNVLISDILNYEIKPLLEKLAPNRYIN